MPLKTTVSNNRRAAFFLCCAFFFLHAQEHAGEYTVPDEVPLYGAGSDINDGNERLYPIGWSRNGLFAYSTVQWADAAAFYVVELTIQNMASDKFIVTIYKEVPDGTSKPIDYFWRTESKKINTALQKAGIIQTKIELKLPPVPLADDSIHLKVVDSCPNNEEPYAYAIFTKVIAMSKKKGQKTVMQCSNKYFCDQVSIGGYLQNPFSPQIALFLESTGIGLEYNDQYTKIDIVGCSLEKGFKK